MSILFQFHGMYEYNELTGQFSGTMDFEGSLSDRLTTPDKAKIFNGSINDVNSSIPKQFIRGDFQIMQNPDIYSEMKYMSLLEFLTKPSMADLKKFKDITDTNVRPDRMNITYIFYNYSKELPDIVGEYDGMWHSLLHLHQDSNNIFIDLKTGEHAKLNVYR